MSHWRAGRPRTTRISNGDRITTHCLYHRDKRPSLVIWPSGHLYCHGCHHRGHIDDDERLKILYEKFHYRRRQENKNQLSLPFEEGFIEFSRSSRN